MVRQAHHEGSIVVSDDPARAAREFPGATVLRSAARVVELPGGTAVRFALYGICPAQLSALDAARLLVAAGVLKEESEVASSE